MLAELAEAGSPPRVRGKGLRLRISAVAVGITPARAGKSIEGSRTAPRVWDHPRACGEKMLSFAPYQSHVGSPPRARGKVFLVDLVLLLRLGSPPRARGKDAALQEIAKSRGITPACAGKRRGLAGDRQEPRDHPRVRGEKVISAYNPDCFLGSPPRARGKANYGKYIPLTTRITPACAGKSMFRQGF